MDLGRVKTRDALKPLSKGEPHWQRIRPGCFVGFAPSAKEGGGTWHARVYDPDTQRYRRKAFGAFCELPGNAKFAAAKTEAERYADAIEAGGHSKDKIETVADACRAYADSHTEAQKRFDRYVYEDPIATVKLYKLRRRHLADWRSRLERKPSLVSRRKKGEQVTRSRAPSTVNRDMAVLRAALNKVLSPGAPNTEAAWQEALKPTPNANGRRTLYLDRDQRRKLLEHSTVEAEPFIRALCLLPLRPGAMAALTMGDFDIRTSELSIGKDKTGKPRRIKISTQAASVLAAQLADKLPSAPLFMRSNGRAWSKESWKIPIGEAVKAADLPNGATAYTLRHSTITDLVTAGLPLLTIAQISGTSAEMIERHYGHLVSDAAVSALGTLAL